MDGGEQTKPLRWVGSSRGDVKSFPRPVKSETGQTLYAAQRGETDPAAKPLKGFVGRSVLEIVAPHDGNTWRAVYTEMNLIHKRLADAERDHKKRRN